MKYKVKQWAETLSGEKIYQKLLDYKSREKDGLTSKYNNKSKNTLYFVFGGEIYDLNMDKIVDGKQGSYIYASSRVNGQYFRFYLHKYLIKGFRMRKYLCFHEAKAKKKLVSFFLDMEHLNKWNTILYHEIVYDNYTNKNPQFPKNVKVFIDIDDYKSHMKIYL